MDTMYVLCHDDVGPKYLLSPFSCDIIPLTVHSRLPFQYIYLKKSPSFLRLWLLFYVFPGINAETICHFGTFFVNSAQTYCQKK